MRNISGETDGEAVNPPQPTLLARQPTRRIANASRFQLTFTR
jgi:hypothetical protein